MNTIPSLVNKIKKRFNANILNLHEPSLDKTDYKIVHQSLLEKEISTYGRYNYLFEKKISRYIGSNNVVSIINGTSALHLMMKILGIGKNDEVLVQSLTYISSINSIIYNNTATQEGNNIKGSNVIASYSDIQNGYNGEGNIDADPQFTDPENGDFTLNWKEEGSPCIDAGDPDSGRDSDGSST